MNSQHRVIRTLIQTMSPNRATAYIKAFALPDDEEAVLLACDVRRLSNIQAADELHMSAEYLKERRRRAFAHIADELNNR